MGTQVVRRPRDTRERYKSYPRLRLVPGNPLFIAPSHLTAVVLMSGSQNFDDDGEAGAQIERRVLSVSECFVYKVPPLRTASGHRAEEWGLADPLFTGHMRILQTNTRLRIVVYAYRDEATLMSSDENLVLFGECPIEVKPGEDITNFFDAVIDSSRYFVLRLKDPKSARTTNIGIGFREREVAFDVKNALNEYVRFIDRMAKADEMQEKADEFNDDNDEHEHPLGNLLGDLSLKEGVKIHVSSKFKREKSAKDANSVIGTSMGVGLTPPPAAGSTIFVKLKPPPTLVDVTNANDDNSVSNGAAATFADNGGDNGNDYSDDDFGDFEG